MHFSNFSLFLHFSHFSCNSRNAISQNRKNYRIFCIYRFSQNRISCKKRKIAINVRISRISCNAINCDKCHFSNHKNYSIFCIHHFSHFSHSRTANFFCIYRFSQNRIFHIFRISRFSKKAFIAHAYPRGRGFEFQWLIVYMYFLSRVEVSIKTRRGPSNDRDKRREKTWCQCYKTFVFSFSLHIFQLLRISLFVSLFLRPTIILFAVYFKSDGMSLGVSIMT